MTHVARTVLIALLMLVLCVPGWRSYVTTRETQPGGSLIIVTIRAVSVGQGFSIPVANTPKSIII